MQINSKSIQPGNVDATSNSKLMFTSSHAKLYYLIARKQGVNYKILTVGELIGYNTQYKLDLKDYFILNRPSDITWSSGNYLNSFYGGSTFKNREYQWMDIDGCNLRVLLHNTPIMTAVSSLLLPDNFINLVNPAPVYSDLNFKYWNKLATIEWDDKVYKDSYYAYTYSDISSSIKTELIPQMNLVYAPISYNPYHENPVTYAQDNGIHMQYTMKPGQNSSAFSADDATYIQGTTTYSGYVYFNGTPPASFNPLPNGVALHSHYNPVSGYFHYIINVPEVNRFYVMEFTPAIPNVTINFVKLKIEIGANYNPRWTPSPKVSHHATVQYKANDAVFYCSGNVSLNSSRTFLNRLRPDVTSVYIQGDVAKFMDVINACSKPYLYFRGNGLGVLSIEGNENDVETVETEYINYNDKKIPYKTVTKMMKQLNTGFRLTDSQMFDLIKSGYVFKLDKNDYNLVADSDVNLFTGDYGTAVRDTYLVPGRKYRFEVTIRKTNASPDECFVILFGDYFVELARLYFKNTIKQTYSLDFTATHFQKHIMASYSVNQNPIYIYNYRIIEMDDVKMPYVKGAVNHSVDYQIERLTPYTISTNTFDSFVGRNLSERNEVIELEATSEKEQLINTQINFFD